MRADHKPLSPVALEMIWMFCDHILELFGDNRLPPLQIYNKECFDAFCEEYQEDYMMNDLRADEMRAVTLPL